MAKTKKTQLDIDSAAADACGLSYGYYIATKYDVPELPVSVTVPEGKTLVCECCGTTFVRNDKYHVKYCSTYCHHLAKKYIPAED